MAERRQITDTVMGRWLETVNGGQLSRGAVVAKGDAIGLEELRVRQLAAEPSITGDQVTIIVAAAARSGFGKMIDNVGPTALAIGPGAATGKQRIDVVCPECDDGPAAFVIDTDEFFLPRRWVSLDGKELDYVRISSLDGKGNDVLGIVGEPDRDVDRMVLFGGGLPLAEVVGPSAAELGFTPVEEGETFEAATTAFAGPADVLLGDAGSSIEVRMVFDAGAPAPLSGASFGLAVFTTPNAEVVGRSVNPLVELDTIDLLQDDRARQLLERTGVTDADAVEWLDGPEPVDVSNEPAVRIFGSKPDPPGLQSFSGTVTGQDGPWRVGIHVVRSTPDDHVIVAGAHRWPVGTEAGGTAALSTPSDPTLIQARTLLAEAVGHLESR